MPPTLEGKPTSYWVDSAPDAAYPALDAERHVDVAVLGGGIAGISAAVLLKQQGATVAVIEAGTVCGGATGYTTAKVSSLHQQRYAQIESSFGEEGARVYGQSNEAAIEQMEQWIEAFGIDCDWRRKPNYTYTRDKSQVESLEREVQAAERAGLPAAFTDESDLPYDIAGAVRFDNQAEFHPRRYVLALAATIPGDGSHVFQHTRATGVSAGDTVRVETTRGTVAAKDVIVATHFPFLDRGVYFARMHPERSYAIGLYAKGAIPQGMYISVDSPTRSIRATPTERGEMLIVGGEGHKVGQGGDTRERYDALVRWARETFDVDSIAYRWSAQDNMPVDGMPFIGPVAPLLRGVWVATGFQKWGMTAGTVSGMILADLIAGRENPWAETYNSTRFKPLASAEEFVKENLNVGKRFVADHLRAPDADSVDHLEPGEGAITSAGGHGKLAAYRDESGKLFTVSSVCTHLGCQVEWNTAEKSWDCPCHGSRFDHTGAVLEGPAVKDLAPKDVG
jgi:glycine/D-amino acid oxidase-like deaminating enzyme/nitrite reductase/ring-hydroxylating ferredoxin subunit